MKQEEKNVANTFLQMLYQDCRGNYIFLFKFRAQIQTKDDIV